MKISLKRLDQNGFDHVFGFIAFLVFFGVAGTFYLVLGHAATPNTGPIVGIAKKCLDNKWNEKVAYNKIQLYTCNGSGAQDWTLNTSGTIVNSNGYCLDVYHAGVRPATKVDLYPCNGTVAQQWSVNATAHTITNPHSKLCLDDHWASTTNGTQIQIYTCNNTAAQKWTTPTVASGTTTGSGPTSPPITPPIPTPTPKPSPSPSPSPAPSPAPTPSPAPSGGNTSYACITSAATDHCPLGGGYYNYPQISVADFDSNASSFSPKPWINPNIWGASGTNYQQTVYANSPGDWYVKASVSNNSSGAVLAYPNAGWSMPWDNSKSNPETAVDRYSSITSSWNVTIPTDSSTTDGWAAYDLWFNSWADEVMIQTDIVANSNYNCTASDSATIDGQSWHLCQFGSERVMKPGTDDNHLRNVASGSVNIKDILTWLEQNGHLPQGSTWTAGSFGFEVCNTSGTTQTFKVNGLTWNAN